jgi:hypothetical protein
MVEPEEIISHAHNRGEILDAVMVLEVGVHPPDELRDFRPHASLDVELCQRQSGQTRFAYRSAFKLAAVELMGTPCCSLQTELEVILDLRPKLSVVANLDEVLNSAHESGDEVRFHHLGRFFRDDDLGS